MYLAGKVIGKEGTQLFSASLPEGAELAASGWTLTPDPGDARKIAILSGDEFSGTMGQEGRPALPIVRARLGPLSPGLG